MTSKTSKKGPENVFVFTCGFAALFVCNFCIFCLFSIVLLLREHAGTLYFTREYACWHFHAHTGVDSFDSVILSVFASVFCTFGMQKLRKFVEMQARRQKLPPEPVLELFWLTFGLLGGYFCPPLGVLRRYWAALGPPSGVKK